MNNFGIQHKYIQNRKSKEVNIDKKTKDAYESLCKSIKDATEGTEKWKTIIAKELDVSNDEKEDRLNRPYLIYRLQRNPNIVSKLETSIGGKKLAIKMQPYSFRWVNEAVKKSMGFRAQVVKGIAEQQLEFIEKKMDNCLSTPEDVLRCFSQLVIRHAESGWVPLDILGIAAHAMIPIENAISTINEMIERHVIIAGSYGYEFSRRSSVIHQQHFVCTIAYDDDLIDKRKQEAHDPDLLKKLSEETQQTLHKSGKAKKSKTFSETEISEKVKQLSNELKDNNEANKKTILDEVSALEKDRNYLNSMSIDDYHPQTDFFTLDYRENEKKLGRKSSVTIDNENQSVAIITERIAQFAAEQVKELVNDRDHILFEKNKDQLLIEKLQVRVESLEADLKKAKDTVEVNKNKLVKVQAENKALRDFSDMFSMNAQDNMTLLLRKVLKAAEGFMERPRYEKNNELVMAKFTQEINEVVQTISRNITDYKPESKFPPDLR